MIINRNVRRGWEIREELEKFDFRENSDGDREIWGSYAVKMKIDIFCNVTPCNLVDLYQSFGETCYVLL